jgi:TolB protein
MRTLGIILGLITAVLLCTWQQPDKEKVARLIEQLGDKDAKVREAAKEGLLKLGTAVEPQLREAIKGAKGGLKERLEEVLWRIDGSRYRLAIIQGDGEQHMLDNAQYCIVDAAGGNFKNLTEELDGRAPRWGYIPTWLDQGKKLVFSYTLDGGRRFDIYIADTKGDEPTNLTEDLDIDYYLYLAASSDGKRIAFTDYRAYQLHVMDAKAEEVENLSEEMDVQNCRFPKWSPDGKRLVFYTEEGNLYLIDADGEDLKDLMEEQEEASYRDASWSPDGKKILFSGGEEYELDIYTIDLDGKDLKNLTKDLKEVENCYSPQWSPDGKEIVFVAGEEGDNQIYIMNADGTNLRCLTEGQECEPDYSNPQWSPDGKKIAFNAGWDVWVYDIETKKARKITVGEEEEDEDDEDEEDEKTNVFGGWSPALW